MSLVRSNRNASTELRLVSLFRENGIKGWRRGSKLVGRPDFVFPKQRLVIFVDGCFWHGCPRHARIPKSRAAFWMLKLSQNKKRDRIVNRWLRAKAWHVMRIWECALTLTKAHRTISRVARLLDSSNRCIDRALCPSVRSK